MRMKRVLETCPGLTVRQGSVEALIVNSGAYNAEIIRGALDTLGVAGADLP